MAGYSGTPLDRKLGIKPGARVLLVDAPRGFALEAADATITSSGKGPFDVALVFVHARSEIKTRFASVSPRMTSGGGLWFAWPKKASKIATDVTEHAFRAEILPTGWVDNKVCAIDERYSGLRFVLRVSLRK